MTLVARLRPVRLAVGLLVVGCGITACGASATSQVRAKVRQFATAAHDHDYAVICSQVLAPQLLGDIASGGVSCPQAIRLGLAGVADARLVIGRITVAGSRAAVQTLTQARGERTALATLELRRTSLGWRIASLGNAAGG